MGKKQKEHFSQEGASEKTGSEALNLPKEGKSHKRKKYILPGMIFAVILAAGIAAFQECPNWPEEARNFLAKERPRLTEALRALGLTVTEGQANYLLFRAEHITDLKERLLERGVLIRSCANYHGLGPDYYRVCVRLESDNQRLLAALQEVL